MHKHRSVAARALFANASLVVVLVVATVAIAQTRARPRPAAKPKPAASATAEASADDKPPAAASAAPATPPSPEAGVLPPPDDQGSGGGKLSPLNPAANEFSDAGPPASAIDYDRLLAEISSLRARVAAVSDTLFHSRISIALETAGDHGRVAALSVSVDDGLVWAAQEGFRAEDAVTVYEHAVAPGHHAVTLDVERRDDRESTFRSTQRSRFIVDVPVDQKLYVRMNVGDDSNMGGDFPHDKKGQYDLRVQVHAQAEAIGR